VEYKEIILRAPEPEDLEILYKWENDESIWLLSNTIEPFSKHTLRQYIESSRSTIFESGQMRLMIDHAESSKTLGSIDLFDFDPLNHRAGIGVLIADKSERRKGFASMAVEFIIEYSFSKLKLHQLYCNILSSNRHSINLFTALGFVKTGTRKDWIRDNDTYKDESIFQLIDSK
jgi:diamine N-acetyltransferase